jgi:indolepyruvate ferredoxin oxidoreductase alpha subunit
MAKAALLLTRDTQQPVMLRTTTRVNHLRGPVRFGPLAEPAPLVPFVRDPRRFVPVPAVARARHHALAAKLEDIRKVAENSPFTRSEGSGSLGVVASGVSRAYLHDVLREKGWRDRVRVFHLGMTWPLPEKALEVFMRQLEALLVLEEGEPLLEEALRALAHRLALPLDIRGKEGPLGICGEYSPLLVHDALVSFVDKVPPPVRGARCPDLPQRPPSLCAGCAHRSAFFAVRKVFGDEALYSSDIGCYTLGLSPPLSAADFLFCMGSSVSAGSGFARFSGRPVVAFIGDSTFFHSGISGLVNAVFNRHNLLVVILDNGTTAMTGHQPNPGADQEVLGDGSVHLDIASLVRGCGVTRVARVGGYNQKALNARLREMKEQDGVRVLIVQEPCVLFARRTLQRERKQRAYVAEQNDSVRHCLETLACPAFRRRGDEVEVDRELCAGCMVCMQISPSFRACKENGQ